MGQLTPPATIAQFKNQFSRDFVYGSGLETVRDVDVQNGLNMASTLYNPRLFDTTPIGVTPTITSEALMAYLYLSAHFMVTALQAAGGLGKVGRGVFSQGEGVVTSKGAGSVNVGFLWPDSITGNAALFQLTKTTYGQAYLQILMPLMVGNIVTVLGETESDVFPGDSGVGL